MIVANETAMILKELSENRYKEVLLSEGVVVISLVIMRGHPIMTTIKGIERLFTRFQSITNKYETVESAAKAYTNNESKVSLPAVDAATIKVIVGEYSLFAKEISPQVRDVINNLGTAISLVGV